MEFTIIRLFKTGLQTALCGSKQDQAGKLHKNWNKTNIKLSKIVKILYKNNKIKSKTKINEKI